MSRDLPTGMPAAVSAATVAPVFLVELDWPDGVVRAWNGYGDITWNSQSWLGTGHLGGISDVRESRDGAANGLTISLSGIPSSQIALALDDESQGRSAKVYFGVLSAAGTFAIDPYLIFDGVIDICPIEDNGDTATIAVQIEKELIDMRTRGRRYTHEDQLIDYPADLGFQYVAGLAEREIMWGSAKLAPAVVDNNSEPTTDPNQ